MKKGNLTALTFMGLVLATGVAHANYECKSGDNASTLTVNEHHITQFGNASIVFKSGTEQTEFYGTIKSLGGMLLEKKIIELHPFQGDTLTIVSKPMLCGRGSCDFKADSIITANLKIGETSTFFYCNETSP